MSHLLDASDNGWPLEVDADLPIAAPPVMTAMVVTRALRRSHRISRVQRADADGSQQDAVMRFIRESQIAAGTVVPPVDPIAVAGAIHHTFAAAPECFDGYPRVEMAKVLLALGERVIGREDLWTAGFKSGLSRGQRAADAIRIIVARHSRPSLALCDIAHELDVSTSYLSEVLNRCSGYGFLTHLHATRVLHALVLLSSTRQSIGRVGCNVGYKHEFQLARHFFARLGLHPTRFRHILDR